MASVEILEQLFQAARASVDFSGLKDEAIRKACEKRRYKTDAQVLKAIENIKHKDNLLREKSAAAQEKLDQNADFLQELHQKEQKQDAKDIDEAEKLLESLF